MQRKSRKYILDKKETIKDFKEQCKNHDENEESMISQTEALFITYFPKVLSTFDTVLFSFLER